MSHMLHSSLCGSLFATPCPRRYEISCLRGVLLERSQQKRPSRTLRYSAAFKQRSELWPADTWVPSAHCLSWVRLLVKMVLLACSCRRGFRKSAGTKVFLVIQIKFEHSLEVVSIHKQYSLSCLCRICPPSPWIWWTWHVFIDYMDLIISPIKWYSEPLFLGSCVMSHLQARTPVHQSIFTFIETNLVAGMIQQHLSLS